MKADMKVELDTNFKIIITGNSGFILTDRYLQSAPLTRESIKIN